MKKTILVAVLAAGLSASAQAQLLFTQYYEGASNNKFVELKNLGSDSIDLSLYTISVYANATAEAWKAGTATTNTTFGQQQLSGTLAAGAVFLIANGQAALPAYAVAGANLLSSNATNFNGNDSITLWTGTTYTSTNQLVDVLSFTAGNEGVDKSFVRLNANVGWDLTAGSNITQFSSVWTVASLTDVAGASEGTDNYLGSSTVAAVPEPGTIALIGLGLGAVLFGARRRVRA